MPSPSPAGRRRKRVGPPLRRLPGVPGPPMRVEVTASPYTFEGRMQQLGAFTSSIRPASGWKGWVGRAAVLIVLLPTLLAIAYQLYFLFAD